MATMVEHRAAHPSRLQRTGANILSPAGSPPGSQPGSVAGSRRPSSGAARRYRQPTPGGGGPPPGAGVGHGPGSAGLFDPNEWQPAPPSATRTGRLYQSDSCPSLMPRFDPAENVPVLKHEKLRRVNRATENVPKAVWTDSVQHLGGEDWPAHAIPLFVFTGNSPVPRPSYREEMRFSLSDDKYVQFGLKLRCGVGDRHMGGTIGVIHNAHSGEALPGDRGQLLTITDLTVLPDSTIIVSGIGDLDFTVKKAWMPRGMRGLQMAFVDIAPAAPQDALILDTCLQEPNLRYFGELLRTRAPQLAGLLNTKGHQKFTVFVPTHDVLVDCFGPEMEAAPEDMEEFLACHIIPGKIPCEAMYNDRTMQAIDGTLVNLKFERWPRSDPTVNDISMEHMDVMCCNGVVHTIAGVLIARPGPRHRNY